VFPTLSVAVYVTSTSPLSAASIAYAKFQLAALPPFPGLFPKLVSSAVVDSPDPLLSDAVPLIV